MNSKERSDQTIPPPERPAQRLRPITSKEFQKVVKGCRIRYRNLIPQKELKATLGYCPKNIGKVEIRDDTGFCKVYESLCPAVIGCGISNPSVLKYALDQGKSTIKRRSDKKIFHVEEVR